MAYIGRQLVRGQNRVLDDISGSFNGSTTAFNLTVSSASSPPASVNQLWIILGGVLQKPGTDFTVADAVITFTTAPASTLSFWGMIQGDTSDINAPSDASVTPSKIANSGDFAFPADVRFKDADGSHYVGLQAPSTVSSNLVWTLPAADGSANQVLKTDGSGALGWATDSALTLVDEDNMSSNSASSVPSQQSVKAYVDAGDLSLIDEDNMSTDSATRPPSQQSVKAYADTKAALTGSTNNTITTVTGANAIQGEANLTYDGTTLKTQVAAENGTIAHFALSGQTNNPAFLIKADDSDQKITLRAGSDTSNYSSIAFNMGTAGDAVNIDSSGRLLIGTTTEGHANGDDLTIATSGDTGMTIRSGSSNNGRIYFSDATSGAGEYAGALDYDHADDKFTVFTASGERMRILSGGGITFNGDTAAANALSDYEYGTWTPSFNALSTGSMTTNYAKYVKVGNLVHVTFYVSCSSSSSNDFQMSMPFTNNNNGSWNPITIQNNGSGSTALIGRIDEDSTLLRVITHSTDDKQSYNDLNGEWIIGAGTYITDAS